MILVSIDTMWIFLQGLTSTLKIRACCRPMHAVEVRKKMFFSVSSQQEGRIIG